MVAFAADYAPTTEAPDAENRARGIFLAVEVHAGENGVESRHPRREKAALSYETASGPTNWLNRDPINEWGGLNLYGFVQNDPVNRWDYLGKLPSTTLDQNNRFSNCGAQKKQMRDELEKACNKIDECEKCGVPDDAFAEVKRLCNNLHEVDIDCQEEDDKWCNDRRWCGYHLRSGGRSKIVICDRSFDDTSRCPDQYCTLAHELFHAAERNVGSSELTDDAFTLAECIGCPGGTHFNEDGDVRR